MTNKEGGIGKIHNISCEKKNMHQKSDQEIITYDERSAKDRTYPGRLTTLCTYCLFNADYNYLM